MAAKRTKTLTTKTKPQAKKKANQKQTKASSTTEFKAKTKSKTSTTNKAAKAKTQAAKKSTLKATQTTENRSDYMNEAQHDHFRNKLLDWKRQLMAEVDRTMHYMRDAAANDPDPADRATQEEEFSLELRARDRERKLIKKIDSTIELIEQDDYGYCKSCGLEIGIHRLEARPTATQCIDCKTLDEIKEKQLLG